MAVFHTLVRLAKYNFPDQQFTVYLSGGVTTAHVGLPVTQDLTAANTMKLATAGLAIQGAILSVEARVNEGTTVGTVEFEFATRFTIDTGLTGANVVAVGSRLEGGTVAGTVRAIDLTGTPSAAVIAKYAEAPIVWELPGDGTCVCRLT